MKRSVHKLWEPMNDRFFRYQSLTGSHPNSISVVDFIENLSFNFSFSRSDNSGYSSSRSLSLLYPGLIAMVTTNLLSGYKQNTPRMGLMFFSCTSKQLCTFDDLKFNWQNPGQQVDCYLEWELFDRAFKNDKFYGSYCRSNPSLPIVPVVRKMCEL